MKKKTLLILLLSFILLCPLVPQASAQTDVKTELLEQALLQQLHATIYQSLQKLYREEFPQYEDIKIIDIESYVTGKGSLNIEEERKVSAAGGATVYNITVQLKAIHHHEIVQMTMSNEQNGATYTVNQIKTRK